MILDGKACGRRERSLDRAGSSASAEEAISTMVLGVGAFAYSTAQILKESGAEVATYLTRDYAHYAPSLAGPTFLREQFPSPCPLMRERQIKLVIPMSIDWAQAPWKEELLKMG